MVNRKSTTEYFNNNLYIIVIYCGIIFKSFIRNIMVSDEIKAFMDLWFVWMPATIIVFNYIKSVINNWNED